MTVGNVTRTYGPDDGVLKIRKFVEHEFMRADAKLKDEEKDAGSVEVMEWSDPGNSSLAYYFTLQLIIVEMMDSMKSFFATCSRQSRILMKKLG